jgi:putative hydrolase of the HAD superfamily
MVEDRLQMLVQARRALIFDLFHTLTSLESTGTARPRTADILGVPWDRWYEQLADTANERFIGKLQDPFDITRKLAHAIDPGIPEQKIREATVYRLERFKGALIGVPEATERTLVSLKTMGKKLGLVSNADVVEAAGWDDSPIAPLFDCVVFSCRVGYVKPQLEIFELCLRDLEVSPGNCIFVGDGGSHELEGARGAGLTTVMITGHIKSVFPDKIEARRPHADFVIEHLDQLVAP